MNNDTLLPSSVKKATKINHWCCDCRGCIHFQAKERVDLCERMIIDAADMEQMGVHGPVVQYWITESRVTWVTGFQC